MFAGSATVRLRTGVRNARLGQCTAPSRSLSTQLPRRPRIVLLPANQTCALRQKRHASFISNYFSNLRQVGRDQMRSNPIMFPVAVAVVFFLSGALGYAVWLNVKVRREMGSYPEAIGVKLRRAIYFTDHQPDAAQAMKAFLGAIKLAQEENLHPLSNEVLGIYLEMARFLEKNGNIKEAIEVLENSRVDCLKWIDTHGQEEGAASTRSRLLQRCIQIAHKIGELYSSEYYPNQQKAEEYLVWAVETALKENERRQKEGLKPGEGEVISRDQQGAQLEALGHHYEEHNNHFLAAQLFLQALTIKPEMDCHTVVLMNNLAAAIVQQNPPPEPGSPPPSPEQLRESGRAWAKKALELARTIKPPQRNGECDQGCAVATHNLGEFAEMDGDIAAARELYEEAGSLAHAIGFQEGVIAADEAVRRITRGKQKKADSTRNPSKKSSKSGGWW